MAQEGGLPQLDPTSYPSQLFWLTVTFVTLYIIMARYIVPRIHSVLENRQDRISHDLDRAASMKAEATQAKDSYEQALVKARNEAQKMLLDVTASIKQTAENKSRELEQTLTAQVKQSEAEIAKARREATNKLEPVAKELAVAIVESLIQVRPDDKSVSNAIRNIETKEAA
jgi:F-type H+-transporting ATPase subunit b